AWGRKEAPAAALLAESRKRLSPGCIRIRLGGVWRRPLGRSLRILHLLARAGCVQPIAAASNSSSAVVFTVVPFSGVSVHWQGKQPSRYLAPIARLGRADQPEYIDITTWIQRVG